MSIEEIKLLIGLIAEGVALVGTIIAFGKNLLNKIKEAKLKTFVEEAMIQVESLAISGELKKTKVLEEVCKKFGESKEIYEKAGKYIEECIYFSKKINNK